MHKNLNRGLTAALCAMAMLTAGAASASASPEVESAAVPGVGQGPSTGMVVGGTEWQVSALAVNASTNCNFGQVCGNVADLEAFVRPLTAGPYSTNLVRVRTDVTIEGRNVEVAVGVPAGVSAGFTVAGNTCSSDWWDGDATTVSVEVLGSICTGTVDLLAPTITMGVTGAVRIGSSWTAVSGSSEI